MSSFFEPIFSTLIRTRFENDEDMLVTEYNLRYDLRKKFGVFSGEWDDILQNEWNVDFNRIVKFRNWLWYLMKSGQYDLLDEQLGTSIYQDKIVYENKRSVRPKIIKPKWYEGLNNYKYWLCDVEEVVQDDSWLIEYYNTPSTYKQKRRATSYDKENKTYLTCVWPIDSSVRSREDCSRIVSLFYKLKDKISSLFYSRVKNPDIELKYILNKTHFQGNSEESVGGDQSVTQTDKQKNVVLTETEITQSEVTAIPNIGWSGYASSDVVSKFDTLVDRWFRVGTYRWTVDMPRNTTITSIDLPRFAIFSGGNTCDQPNKIPFRVHRYWRGNMIVKIHINCNKFQIGQLQCSWYYQPKADSSFSTKSNVFTRSGTHHCVISAAPNNEVELIIPYKAYKSLYHTKTFNGDQKDLPLDLGTLFITVLSPLKTTGETSSRCSFTVFVRFTDNEFTGMLAGDVDTPPQVDDQLIYQMDTVGTIISALPTIERMLTSSSNDNNRDNPPYNAAPSYLVPTASHSWAIGTDIAEPVHNLRLSGRAQTCHPDSDFDEMKVDVLKRKYMLLDIFLWSQQNINGFLLWSLPVNPIPPKDRMFTILPGGVNILPSYQLTPIGFLSSLYQYWRGSIEFRFDIVASQFHSGKLMLAYIPGIPEGETVTIDQARASPNITLSLDNAMTYTWRVPYIADRPWWPRRYSGESVTNNGFSPSKIFAFVLNELVMAETVSDTVEILVYMRGGEDMEFSVPVQPSIGLGFDRDYIASRNPDDVFPVSTTKTYYCGDWNKTPLVQVLRHAATSQAVGRFSEPILDRPVYYILQRAYPRANISFAVPAVLMEIRHYIFLRGVGFSEFIGLPYYHDNSAASLTLLENLARAAFANTYTYGSWLEFFLKTPTQAYGLLPQTISTTSNTFGGSKTIPFIGTTVSPQITSLSDLEYQGNREDSLTLVDNTQSLLTTNSGMFTFGEKFVDLKDLCRRYQIYGWTSVPAANIERDPGACSFLFPVLPQGLELAINTSTTVNQIWNRAREGHIPLISSLYRFYRGSIRVRIVVSDAPGLVIWIQHRPDRRLDRNVITPCTLVTTAEAVFNHTYGVYMQDLDVNSVVELEIPFYQMANYGLLQRPVIETDNLTDWSNFYSLGELSVGFFGTKPVADVRCTIYYSIADDCHFSTFQGIPPMVLLDDLPEFESPLHYQGITDYFFKTPRQVGEEITEGMSDSIQQNVQPMLNSILSTFKNNLSDTYSCVSDSIKDLDISGKMAAIASQVLHAINNPSATTIAISVVSILVTLGIITYASFTIAKSYVVSIWQWIEKKVSSNKVQEEAENHEPLVYQNNSDDNAVTGFLSLICGGLCTLFGFKSDSVKYESTSDALFKNIDKGMKMSNVCFTFFRNFMSVICDMKTWIVSRFYPGFNAAQTLMNGQDIIEKWIRYSQDVCDPIIAQNIKYSRHLQNKLLDCYAFGKILRSRAFETQYPAIIQLINNTFDKLHKLHVEMTAQGVDPHVRKMPFVIYNYGAPEIGKSHLTTDLCTELCNSEGIKSETQLMCVLNATSKFWDNCDRQPCLVMDDAFNIRKGTMLEDQVASIFNVVSPVVLVPPRAAVEDKGRTYNPEIFILNSNIDFFKTELCLEEALWRRRDILIHSVLDPDFEKEDCIHCINKLKVDSNLPKEAIASLKDFHHLKFKYTFDVKNPNCAYLPEDRYLKYDELLALLKDLFKKNRQAENIKFANRVAHTNKIVGEKFCLVNNVDNLEQLWNDAITARRLATETYDNTTWKVICKSFSNSVYESWSNFKHGILKKIYNVLQPHNNRYFLLNEGCSECCRIKYQCISCKCLLDESIRQHQQEPSTSSMDSIDVIDDEDDPKFQGNSENILQFEFNVKFDLTESANKWFRDLPKFYPYSVICRFNEFLKDYGGVIVHKLSFYPKCARSINVFKNICESVCTCIHNCSINMPYLHDNILSFINPLNPSEPVSICDLKCNTSCWMGLPWKVWQTVQQARRTYPEHEECWMSGMIGETNRSLHFSSIFSSMIQWVFDFYYKRMKPAVKAIFTFFSNFTGWILGLSFLSLLFSTTIMGVGAYECMATGSAGCNVNSNYPSGIVSNAKSIKFQSNSYESGKPKVVKANKAKVKIPIKVTKDLEYQSSQQFSVVEDRLASNLVSIDAYIQSGELSKRVSNHCLMLRDNLILIQRHYYDYWRSLDITTKFYLKTNNLPTPHIYGFPLLELLEYDVEWFSNPDNECIDSNFGILYLPNTIPAFKNIIKFIAKSEEHEYIKSDEVYLFNCENLRSMHCNMHVEYNKQVTENTSWLRLDECYAYRYTKIGLCGSVLLCKNLERPIIGIHFAGNSNTGFSEPICQESFVGDITRNYTFECFDMALEDNKHRIDFDTLLYPQGTVPNKHAHHQGSVSQYIPSLIQGVYDVDTAPNPLSVSDDRLPQGCSPLKMGCEHMGKPPLDFEISLLKDATLDLQDVILRTVKPIRIKIDKLSYQDAICGNVNVHGFEPLEWSSSEGFPLRSLRPQRVRGKKWLFSMDETSTGYILKDMHGELKRQLTICDGIRKQGKRIPTLFIDCLKDTCIDIEKCSIPGKTRIFSISPVQYTIAFKQYFGDFLASYQNSRIVAEHGIGINVDSIEWSNVANYITTFNNKIVAGDYKNFGPSLMLSCVRSAFDIIMAWYERYDNDVERQLVRRVLLSEILYAKHLCLNVVYGVLCGIPSGSPITTPLNSLVNSLYLRCAWRSITNCSFSIMHENIRILTYGDDVCINVSDNYIDIFNTETISVFFKKYNIVFTDIDKSDNIVRYRTLDNVTFLKRGFKRHPYNNALFLSPIDEQSIRKCVSWITRKGDPILNTLENCKQACELAFGRGPKYYNKVRECLQAECLKIMGKSFSVCTWQEKSEQCYNM